MIHPKVKHLNYNCVTPAEEKSSKRIREGEMFGWVI